MAYCEEADEDFKLPLRTWLEKQINGQRFKGLEWLPSESDSKMFKLPWVKKNFPDWEEYYKIFRAWADHRGRGEVGKLDDSKLKSNFRCALNKSVDFEEETSRSQLQKQTGNYKVYRILSPKAVRERRKKRSRSQAKKEPNRDSKDLKIIDDKDLLDSIDSSPSSVMSGRHFSSDNSRQSFATSPFSAPVVDMPTFSVHDEGIPCAQIDVRPPDNDDFRSISVITPAHTPVEPWNAGDVPMEVETPGDDEPYCKKTAYTESDSVSARNLILQQLENAGFSKDRLSDCQIIITYNGEKVVDKELTDMDKGYRIFYGSQSEQFRLLQMRNATDEKLADMKLEGISLPPPSTPSHTMSAILNKTEFGLIVGYDPQTLQLYAKRLCQSQVFFFDPHDQYLNASPEKLEREAVVPLFSFEKYFLGYMQQFLSNPNGTPPEADIVLSVGIKPKSKIGLQAMKGLKIELIPHVLKCVMPNNREYNSSISLCFSNPTSMENLLRQMHYQSPTLFGTNRWVRC